MVTRDVSARRSFDEALQIAQNAIGMLEGQGVTRASCKGRRISLKDTHTVRCGADTRAAEAGLDTLMYVFNFEDSLGFAVVSANRATPGLIAVTESGYYNPEERQDNVAFEALMENAKCYISGSRYINPPIDSLNHDTLYDIVDRVWPLVQVKWGQTTYYSKYCPNGYAGCAPIAVAQVLTYFANIDSMDITYQWRDVDKQLFDWPDIRRHRLSYIVNGVEASHLYCNVVDSLNTHNAIGRLCRQLGEIMKSNYSSPGITGTEFDSIVSCLSFLGFSNVYKQSVHSKCFKDSLKSNHVFLVKGKSQFDIVGHVWIVDGFFEECIVAPTIYDEGGNIIVPTYIYNHINWGWNGMSNGYYLDEVFDVNNCYQLDANPYGQMSGNRYKFTQSLEYIDVHL